MQLGRVSHSYDLMSRHFACAIFMLMPFSGSGIQLQYLVGDIMGDQSMVGLLAGIKAGAEFFCFLLVPKGSETGKAQRFDLPGIWILCL